MPTSRSAPEVKPAKMLVRETVADPLYMTSEDDCDSDGEDDCDDDDYSDDSHMTCFHDQILCQPERGEDDDDEITLNAFIIMSHNI